MKYLHIANMIEYKFRQRKNTKKFKFFNFSRIPKLTNVEWPKLDPSKKELRYLHIAGPDKISMDSNINLGEKEFWNSINFNENKLQPTTGINKEEL